MRSHLLSAIVVCVSALPTVRVFADEPKPVELNQLRLYVPIPELEDRFGKDVEPLADYIKALEKKTGELVGPEKEAKAKGLLIAVGIKSKTKTRVWCQAIEGEVPPKLLEKLETELAKVKGIDLKKSPAGFAMEIKLFGRTPTKFPKFPDVWVEAAKKSNAMLLIPPDELFKNIWPD
jgi:hypothetical protein